MKKDLVIFGAGGLGREVLFQIQQNSKFKEEYNILGFVDDTPSILNKFVNGYRVLGNSQWLYEYSSAINVIICLGNAVSRKNVARRLFNNKNISFPTFIADDVRISEEVSYGIGCIFCFSCIITVNIEIGDFVVLNSDCTVGHDSKIENYVTLYPSVNVSGNVHIGECSEIGVGSNIIQGKKIGTEVIVGAGSVVIKDIPSQCTAVGVPAKPIKMNNNSTF